MMRSLFSGVSGLRVHQTRMDVIGNNIANVNTVGYKAARMTFADAMSQRISGAMSDMPDVGRAGRNPMQIGLGVNIGGIDAIMNQGAAQRTDRALDLTVQGRGFFIVQDGPEAGNHLFTRAGNVQWNGNIFSIDGKPLVGWNAVEDAQRPGSYVIDTGTLTTLTTGPEIMHMDASATSLIDIMGNLNINDLVEGHIVRPVQFYDSLGNIYSADVRFTWHPPGEDSPYASTNAVSNWTFEFLPAGDQTMIFPGGRRDLPGIPVNMQISIAADNVASGGVPAPSNRGRVGFSPETGRLSHMGVGPGDAAGRFYRPEFVLNFQVPALLPPSVVGHPALVDDPSGYNSGDIMLSKVGIRQQMGELTSLRADFADGNASGSLQDISIGEDGIITARYTNGEMRPLAQVPLAMHRNPEGLERVGNNFWTVSANSGEWYAYHGDLMPGTLEMSNVELSGEFTEMITTQRGFQANSRVITTSDEMLQELVNLKR